MGIFKLPVDKQGDTYYISDHTDIALGMNAKTSHPEEAKKFLQWMTTPEFATLYANALPGFFPLATSVADAEAMLFVCKKAGVRLMTAFPMRFSPPLLEVKARLDAGELGTPRCITSSNQGQLPTKHRAWFADPRFSGGGALTDHIVHLSDIFRWYLGTEITEVYAQSNHILHKDTVSVETGGMVSLGFEDSVFASINCSWSRPKIWPTWGGLSFELVTDRGVIRVDGFSQNVECYSDANGAYSLLPWGSDANQGMIEEFIACINENREPSVSGADGLAAVKVIQAAYESAKTGKKVTV
ncbi:hypothetical protein MASR2M78_15820 [Treponema sp.]